MKLPLKYRNCPCIKCLCRPICRFKASLPRLWVECSIVSGYFFQIPDDGQLGQVKRMIAVTEIFRDPPWKDYLIQYYKNQYEGDYHTVFQKEIHLQKLF